MQQQMQQQMQAPNELRQADTALQNVMAAIQNTNWEELERVDPGDAALQRQKLNEAYQGLSYQREQIMGAVQQQQQHQYPLHEKQSYYYQNPVLSL